MKDTGVRRLLTVFLYCVVLSNSGVVPEVESDLVLKQTSFILLNFRISKGSLSWGR